MVGVSAHEGTCRIAGIVHRDVSLNHILICERVGDSRPVVRAGVPCDWELCQYREQLGAQIVKRQPCRSVCRFLLSIMYRGCS